MSFLKAFQSVSFAYPKYKQLRFDDSHSEEAYKCIFFTEIVKFANRASTTKVSLSFDGKFFAFLFTPLFMCSQEVSQTTAFVLHYASNYLAETSKLCRQQNASLKAHNASVYFARRIVARMNQVARSCRFLILGSLLFAKSALWNSLGFLF